MGIVVPAIPASVPPGMLLLTLLAQSRHHSWVYDYSYCLVPDDAGRRLIETELEPRMHEFSRHWGKGLEAWLRLPEGRVSAGSNYPGRGRETVLVETAGARWEISVDVRRRDSWRVERCVVRDGHWHEFLPEQLADAAE